MVNDPSIDAFTAMTKTGMDELWISKVRIVIDQVVKEILLVEGVINAGNTNNVLMHLVSYLSSKNSEARVKFYIELAGRIAVALTDGKLTLAEAVELTQWMFRNNTKK